MPTLTGHANERRPNTETPFLKTSLQYSFIFDSVQVGTTLRKHIMFPQSRARQTWGPALKGKTVDDNTWYIPYHFVAPNQTIFTFKAGNKDYALDAKQSNSADGAYKKISELGLRKKYG